MFNFGYPYPRFLGTHFTTNYKQIYQWPTWNEFLQILTSWFNDYIGMKKTASFLRRLKCLKFCSTIWFYIRVNRIYRGKKKKIVFACQKNNVYIMQFLVASHLRRLFILLSSFFLTTIYIFVCIFSVPVSQMSRIFVSVCPHMSRNFVSVCPHMSRNFVSVCPHMCLCHTVLCLKFSKIFSLMISEHFSAK